MCGPKRYKIKCPYTKIIEEDEVSTVVVEAYDEVEAVEKAWDKIYSTTGLDYDHCEEGDVEILEETYISRFTDEKTRGLFDGEEEGDADDCNRIVPRRDEDTG